MHRYVHEVIDNLEPGSVVRTGNAAGIDQIAKARALARGLTVEDFNPDYGRYPVRVAPLIRNEDMAETDAEVCFAFVVAESKGTMHCVREFLKRGKAVMVYHFDQDGNYQGFATAADYE